MAWIWRYSAAPDNAVNLAVTDGAEVMFYVKEVLKQAGWTVKMSGDSLSYFAASDGITHFNAGAGGMSNNNAWFRIADPGGVREYTFQRGASDAQYRHKYSASVKFTGGAPSATVTPSATDEAVLLGAGTDAAPSFANGFSAVACKVHIGADTAAPYSWFCVEVVNAATTAQAWLLGDGLTASMSPVGDTDQWITQWYYGSLAAATITNGTTGVGKGWFKKGLVGAAFVAWPCAFDVNTIGVTPVNPITGNDEALVIPLCRTNTMGSGGWKGFAANVRVRLTASRQIPDYLDDAGPPVTRWAYFDALAVPYPPTVIPTT